jgi:hypothetical protein
MRLDDRANGETASAPANIDRFERIERKHQANKAVRAKFQKNARKDHRASSGSFGVRVRQPGVKGPQRNFDAKAIVKAQNAIVLTV